MAIGFSAFLLAPAAGARTRASTATSLLQAVNRTRSAHGLRALRLDTRLVRAARSHSLEMLRGNFFAHGDFHGRMVAFRVQGPTAGENLAWGNGSYARPATIVAEWLASPEHRANLLRPGWTRIGIGLARGTFLGNGGSTVVTADFAGR
ncbi:MAG TPA: CAP domain-containing protein [Gaiellaceae bacterium]|nr:CAP domain-containing protein [Gaiellaceae bacterium]